MRHLPLERPAESHVRVVFATSIFSFDLPRAATFEDLADRLSRLGEHSAGPLISLSIQADSPAVARSIRSATSRRRVDVGGEAGRVAF